MSLTPHAFVTKWQHTELTERASAQAHFIDLCALLGQPTPADSDPHGTHYAFERGASKADGGEGWADVWKRGCFAWEYKRKGANLTKAYAQLQQYRESLENPPLLIVSDIATIEIHTNFTGSVKHVYHFTLNDLLDPAQRTRLAYAWTQPESLRVHKSAAQATEEAAEALSHLAERLRKRGADPARAAHFLIRLLFCLFAEDAQLLPAGLFGRLIEATRRKPHGLSAQLRQLFEAMAHGGFFGTDEIAHFNGGLFDNAEVCDLDADEIEILATLHQLDWSSIEPAVLGTLFERSLDPSKRSQLGAHYTAKDDILLIVEPVLMAPLRRQWASVKLAAEKLMASKPSTTRTRKLDALLRGFADEIAATQVLDPACGSGNFLYVALKQMLDLEKEVVLYAAQCGLSRFFPSVSPLQLHGIELNEYAHQLAQATIWIGYIQWLRDNGFGQPAEPILRPIESIQCMDAVLAHDAAGHPGEPPWPPADVIIGNPPFLGGNKIRQELGDAYVEALFALYAGRVPASADLVCYWFERTRALIEKGTVKRAGLLATQGIRGGANRKVLERIKESGDIFLAWSDRDWILNGATVHVALIGFDDKQEQERALDGKPVGNINSDLTSRTADISSAEPLKENGGICFMGASPKGPFDIDAELARAMLSAPQNINGRSNADVVRPVVSGIDLVGNHRGKWTIDFGLLSIEDAALYEVPFEYAKKHVYPVRSKNRRVAYAKKWWQYAEARPGMRKALSGLSRFIATPEVAKHRVFVWISPEVLCNQQTLVFARDDDYFFGVLHAWPHELWARGTGTQLREAESGFRYTPTTTFETYPFPFPPGHEPAGDARVAAIAAAARELVAKRAAWLSPPGASAAELKKRTLTALYNARPEWLALAHRKLDEAVLAAYGWPVGLSAEEVLARLLALNLARAGGGGTARTAII